jgi:hypothetical protein
MFEPLLWATGAVIIGAMAYAYKETKDPMFPLMFLGPLCLYAFVYRPGVLFYRDELDFFFPEAWQLEFVQLLHLIGVGLLCFGCLKPLMDATEPIQKGRQSLDFSEDARRAALRLGLICGFLALFSYLLAVFGSGGFQAVYGQAKGTPRTAVGYLNELPLLSYPAILLLFISWKGKKWHIGMIFMILLFMVPNLVHGVLGARRGPTFLVLSTVVFSWFLTTTRKVNLIPFLGAVGLIGGVVLFLFQNRQYIYLGSQELQLDSETIMLEDKRADTGDEYVFTAGLILVSMETDTYFWGRRYLATLFVRPIPRQIWPNKYEDLGLGWMVGQSSVAGITDLDWINSVGWVPLRGSSVGLVADSFQEFSYGYVVICYLLGFFYTSLWMKARRVGEVWLLLYLFGAILSIYIPTQGLATAWAYRFMFMGLPTYYLWNMLVTPEIKPVRMVKGMMNRRRPTPTPPQRPQRQREHFDRQF